MADAPKKKKKKKPHRFYDYSLLLSVVFLTIFGLIMIYSASSYRAVSYTHLTLPTIA